MEEQLTNFYECNMKTNKKKKFVDQITSSFNSSIHSHEDNVYRTA